uniref:Uncharacterized protein n=1 Tax=Thermofilum pendens TaxID=2269 RepID=A0A7C4FDX7_THEPE
MYTRTVLPRLAVAAAVLVLPSLALLSLQQEDLYNDYINLYTALAAVTATHLCFTVIHRLRGSPPHVVRPWMLLTLGLALWAVAEITWFLNVVASGVPLEPTISDLFWLLGYLPLAAGLWGLSSPFLGELKRLGYSRGRASTLAVLVAVLILLVLTAFYRVAVGASEGPRVLMLNISYVLLDTLLLVISLIAASVFREGLVGTSLRLVAVGFLLFTAADLLYTAVGTYAFVPADIIYALSYPFVAVGLWVYLERVVPSTGV